MLAICKDLSIEYKYLISFSSVFQKCKMLYAVWVLPKQYQCKFHTQINRPNCINEQN